MEVVAPPRFHAEWDDKIDPAFHEHGLDFAFMMELIKLDLKKQVVRIGDKTTAILRPIFPTPNQEVNFPLYFEVTGGARKDILYVFMIWSNWIVIEKRKCFGDGVYAKRWVSYPGSNGGLSGTIQEVADDLA
jgi:hypothetical protein